MVTLTGSNPHTITLSPVPTTVIACFAFPQTLAVASPNQPLKISVFNNQPAPGSFKVYVDLAGNALYSFSWMAVAKA
jgi:hypothetical protein